MSVGGGGADDSAREALGMLLVPDENGKIIKSIEYFNTVSRFPLIPLFSLFSLVYIFVSSDNMFD
jgi:hypothetical protein